MQNRITEPEENLLLPVVFESAVVVLEWRNAHAMIREEFEVVRPAIMDPDHHGPGVLPVFFPAAPLLEGRLHPLLHLLADGISESEFLPPCISVFPYRIRIAWPSCGNNRVIQTSLFPRLRIQV